MYKLYVNDETVYEFQLLSDAISVAEHIRQDEAMNPQTGPTRFKLVDENNVVIGEGY